MMKKWLTLILLFGFFTTFAQKAQQRFYAQVYKLNSKEFRGFITEATDSSLTIQWQKNIHSFKYSELKTIKMFRFKRNALYFYPSTVGFGFVVASPFQPTFKKGLTTAGIGLGIVVLSAAMEVTFRKTIEKIPIKEEPDVRSKLEKYVIGRMPNPK